MCSRCGLPLAGLVDRQNALCAVCRRDEPHFDVARSYGVYSKNLRGAVLALKFHERQRLGVRLGGLLLESWKALESAAGFEGPCLVVPVPLHPRRERERGYNQAGLLARGLVHLLKREAGRSGAILVGNSLVRRRATAPQSGLSLHARRENVSGVFAVSDPERIHQRDIVLVDDVMTTGATASACASVLKRAGARRVFVLTLARATPQFPHSTLRVGPPSPDG